MQQDETEDEKALRAALESKVLKLNTKIKVHASQCFNKRCQIQAIVKQHGLQKDGLENDCWLLIEDEYKLDVLKHLVNAINGLLQNWALFITETAMSSNNLKNMTCVIFCSMRLGTDLNFVECDIAGYINRRYGSKVLKYMQTDQFPTEQPDKFACVLDPFIHKWESKKYRQDQRLVKDYLQQFLEFSKKTETRSRSGEGSASPAIITLRAENTDTAFIRHMQQRLSRLNDVKKS